MSDLPPDQVTIISERMAEEIVEKWRSFRESPWRKQITERLRVNIARAIVDELEISTNDEMFGMGTKPEFPPDKGFDPYPGGYGR